MADENIAPVVGAIGPVHNMGNVQFSCPATLPVAQVDPNGAIDITKMQHPMYKTSSMEYGAKPHTVQGTPHSFHPNSSKFTKHLGKCGMYQNNSFNTTVENSRSTIEKDHLFN